MTAEQRVALVTGCGKSNGIGCVTARLLARQGIAVAVSDLTSAGVRDEGEAEREEAGWRGLDTLVADIREAGGRAVALYGDVSLQADALRLAAETAQSFGRLDILVNNAAAPHGADRAFFGEVPFEAWRRVMAINADGAFLMAQAALPYMRERGWGRIINVSSAVTRYPLPRRAAYTASKSAILGLTRAVAIELAPLGITVNAVCPGSTLTARAVDTARKLSQNGDVEAALAERARQIPLGRHGAAEEIAAVIAFLAGDASSYMTGQAIYVDGGGVPRA